MNIVLVGSLWLGAEVLRALREDGHAVPLVLAPAGEDRLRLAADAAGITVLDDEILTDDARASRTISEAMDGRAVDVIVAAHSFRFIHAGVRGLAQHGAIGYHPSLLPAYRGRHAIEDAVRAGERTVGGSVYRLDEGWDRGTVLLQDRVDRLDGESAADVWRRALAPMGIRLLREAVRSLSAR